MSYSTYGKMAKKNIEKPLEGNVILIKSLEDKHKIIEDSIHSGKLVIVDISANWCSPCKTIKPVYYEMSLKYPCIFCEENLDDEISQGINNVPTFQFFGGGRLLDVVEGADIKRVNDTILKYIGNNEPCHDGKCPIKPIKPNKQNGPEPPRKLHGIRPG